jgi:hypothetical protein
VRAAGQRDRPIGFAVQRIFLLRFTVPARESFKAVLPAVPMLIGSLSSIRRSTATTPRGSKLVKS